MFSFTILSSQTIVTGQITKNGIGVENIMLDILLYPGIFPVPYHAGSTWTQPNGEFSITMNNEYPLFSSIAVSGYVPLCPHGGINFITPKVALVNLAIIDYEIIGSGAIPYCHTCNLMIQKPKK
jgi:hypothetical protein